MAEEKNPIYEPRKFYEGELKKQVHDAAEAKFEELVKAANVDVAANKAHVKAYNEASANRDAILKQVNGYKALRTLFIVLMIVLWVLGIGFLIFGIDQKKTGLIIAGPILFVLGFGALALMIVYSKKAKETDVLLQKAEEEAKKRKDECYADLAELNRSYDYNMPTAILKKATPILDFDPNFSVGRFRYLVDKFGLPESLGATTSIQAVLSGNIQGNPFVLERDLSEEMTNRLYTGSIVITWTTTTHDKNGTHVQTHTQTLTATASHPAPEYATSTRLIYGNEAAPHLTFSRCPSGESGKDEKQLSRFVKSRSKALEKKEKKALTDNDPNTNFTKMGNDKFDALFGADNRDNEVEFRLLYTPLAQKNIIDLLTKAEPFGDDFYQVKDHMLNSVASGHSQSFDYTASPERFVHYDLEAAKTNFVTYIDTYVRNIYFDLAPMLCVPLYQTHKPFEAIYDEKHYGSNFSAYEQEVMANGLDGKSFMPKDADPSLPLILKVDSSKKEGASDVCAVRAMSFHTTPRTDLIPVMGGDGRMHSVPVHWIEYDEVNSVSNMAVSEIGGSARSYREKIKKDLAANFRDGNSHYERGLFSYALGKVSTSEIDKDIRSLFSKQKK